MKTAFTIFFFILSTSIICVGQDYDFLIGTWEGSIEPNKDFKMVIETASHRGAKGYAVIDGKKRVFNTNAVDTATAVGIGLILMEPKAQKGIGSFNLEFGSSAFKHQDFVIGYFSSYAVPTRRFTIYALRRAE